MSRCTSYIIGMFVLCSFDAGTCLRCFNSTSITNYASHTYPVTHRNEIIFCDDYKNYGCVKASTTLPSRDKIVVRNCVPMNFCKNMDDCSICTTDLCNISSIGRFSIFLIAMLTATATLGFN